MVYVAIEETWPFCSRNVSWQYRDNEGYLKILADKLAERLQLPGSEFAMAWLKAELPLADHATFANWKSDEETLLYIAEHYGQKYVRKVFSKAHVDLLDNDVFVENAVQLRPELYWFASCRLHDFNDKLAMVAMGGNTRLLRCAIWVQGRLRPIF